MKTGFALIGAGLFGEPHAQAYSRHNAVDFAWVCELDEARARRMAESNGARRWTTRLEDVLADAAVAAVSVATPDPAHRAVAIACAEAGKHMLIEKPLATTVAVFEHAWILPRTLNTVKDLKLEILGSEGAVYVDGSHNRIMELYTPGKGAFPDMLVPPFGPHLTGFVLDGVVHFIEAVVNGKPVLATLREGLANTRVIAAIAAAANSGSAVRLVP
jgi:predicted dehydrogenase